MSNRCFHTLYYRSYQINEQREKEEKQSAFEKAKNKGKSSKNNKIFSGLTEDDIEDIVDEIEN